MGAEGQCWRPELLGEPREQKGHSTPGTWVEAGRERWVGKGTEQCSCLYVAIKDKGAPEAFKHRAEMEKSSALRSHNSLSTPPTLPLSPDTFSLLPPPTPNIGAIHRALTSCPPFPQFNQLPPLERAQGEDPAAVPDVDDALWGGREGEGSQTPSLLHHPPVMMKLHQRFWQGHGLGSEDVSVGGVLLPSLPYSPAQITAPSSSPERC